MSHKLIIETYPLQAYASALLFSPTCSLIRGLFKHEEPEGITIQPALTEWSACLQIFEGHSSWVNSVVFSRDLTRLASASDDHTIRIWDGSNGACLQTLEGHSNSVTSVAFSYDSSRLASASWDCTVKIWDISSAACLQTFKGHGDSVISVALARDSTRIASASWDGTIKIWDASSAACLQALEGHSSGVNSVLFSRDSTRLASVSNDRTVKIWDMSNGACLQTLEGHGGDITSAVFSRDSNRLASASNDRTVKIWDPSSGACLQTLDIGRALYHISFDDGGLHLHSEIGTIALRLPLASLDTPTVTLPESPRYQKAGLSPDGVWITSNSENVLWLPSEYRPSCSAVSTTMVGIGAGSGRVWMCSFKDSE